MSPRVLEALTSVGATLKRAKKHLVYELPNGNKVTVSRTPSDARSHQNMLTDIRKAAGMVREVKAPRVPREAKPGVERSVRLEPSIAGASLKAALSTSGLIEKQLRTEIFTLKDQIARKEWEIAQAEAALERDWLYRLYRWWRKP